MQHIVLWFARLGLVFDDRALNEKKPIFRRDLINTGTDVRDNLRPFGPPRIDESTAAR